MSDENTPEPGTSAQSAGTSGTPAGRRYPVAPVVLLAVSAAALWGASRMTWVSVRSSDGLTEPRTDDLDGGTWFGALTPLALVLLAAIAAVVQMERMNIVSELLEGKNDAPVDPLPAATDLFAGG
ncbi:Trp biosynthesis-associated membrane protein, partial [Nocardia cyriacigeorgica]|uniref:Trp biosynthesis-associated membrane protein n=1 Tax=Nocardia cyriacigeorgica TaxID=135487 RepID=UPI00189335DA